jgi:hypothetical protein
MLALLAGETTIESRDGTCNVEIDQAACKTQHKDQDFLVLYQ